MVKVISAWRPSLAAILGQRSQFLVTERIRRDFGLLGVIRRREQHGEDRFLFGGHLGQPSWSAILDQRSHFVVTERIKRDFGLLRVIRRREQHGRGRYPFGGHLWQPSWVKGCNFW